MKNAEHLEEPPARVGSSLTADPHALRSEEADVLDVRDSAVPNTGRPLRLLIVAFQGGAQANGGIESLTQLIERYQGMEITILTQKSTPVNERWRRAGCKVVTWPREKPPGLSRKNSFYGKLQNLVRTFAWNVRTLQLLHAHRFDVAHINDPHALWHTIIAAKLTGIPTIYNIRDTKPSVSRFEAFKWRTAFALSAVQIVLSQEMRDYWRRTLTIRARRLMSVYSVVDFQRMRVRTGKERRALRSEFGLSDVFTVGYVASFSEKKAQLQFIENATPKLRRCSAPVNVVFLGDFTPESDSYAAACEAAVRSRGLESQVVFKGYTADMSAWYSAVDAVVVATKNEGLARCMIESLACGTPVISFDVCSAREILEKQKCGMVVRRGDYPALTKAITALAADATLRRKLGENGADVAHRLFGAAKNVGQYVAVYHGLADGGKVV